MANFWAPGLRSARAMGFDAPESTKLVMAGGPISTVCNQNGQLLRLDRETETDLFFVFLTTLCSLD